MVENNSEEVFEVDAPTDQPSYNVLEKGRYQFEVKDIANHTAKNGNKCIKLEIIVLNKTLTDYISLGTMDWKWRQFLFAIGIRDKRVHFTVNKSRIIGSTGMVDINVRPKVFDDGTEIKENRVVYFSPIEKPTAPMADVPPEEDVKPIEKTKTTTSEDDL